jgi:hypothetical protein
LAVSYIGFIWICYGIAGWRRSSLVVSLCAASAVGVLTYLFLVLLAHLLPQIVVFFAGAACAMLITIAILMMARKEVQ